MQGSMMWQTLLQLASIAIKQLIEKALTCIQLTANQLSPLHEISN